MLIRTQKFLLREKTETKGTTKDGREYTKKTLYLKDELGYLYEINFVNDYIYTNCEENKYYVLEYALDQKGNLTINDIMKG